MWLRTNGKSAVISSRIRLARNVKDHLFISKASSWELENVKQKVMDSFKKLLSQENHHYFFIEEMEELHRKILLERHLISKDLCKKTENRAVIFHEDESLSILVNEEDHLRMQMFTFGLNLWGIWQNLNQLDDEVSENIPFAFDRRLWVFDILSNKCRNRSSRFCHATPSRT